MQRFNKIIVTCLLTFFATQLSGQSKWIKADNVSIKSMILQPINEIQEVDKYAAIQIKFSFKKSNEFTEVKGVQILRPDFYTADFGFFCKKELQLEKRSLIPLRFRLGSLEYCNYLEAK